MLSRCMNSVIHPKTANGTRGRIIVNMMVMTVSFLLFHTATQNVTNMQSVLIGVLGTDANMLKFMVMIPANIFLSYRIIGWLGCKWTICLSQLLHLPYILAQLMPNTYTLYSTAVLCGLVNAPMLCAEALYLIAMAKQYALANMPRRRTSVLITASTTDYMTVRFFGIYSAVIYNAFLLGGLVMAWIFGLKYTSQKSTDIRSWHPSNNVTILAKLCGSNFCPLRDNSLLSLSGLGDKPYVFTHYSRMLRLVIIYVLNIVLGSGIFAIGMDSLDEFLDPAPSFSASEDSDDQQTDGCCKKCCVQMLGRNIFSDRQLLLVPITMFGGLSYAFMVADFTESFIACTWGVVHIYFTSMCWGGGQVVGSIVSGFLISRVSRVPVLAGLMVLHLWLLVWLFVHKPQPREFYAYYVMSTICGFIDSIRTVVLQSYYGLVFCGSEALAFSNFRLYETIGRTVSFAISPRMCTGTQIGLLGSILVVGMWGYGATEYLRRKELALELNWMETNAHFGFSE